ncbi:MAG: hypothetical protein ABFS18_09530 [Thermodesulfobacteriota bacterium]
MVLKRSIVVSLLSMLLIASGCIISIPKYMPRVNDLAAIPPGHVVVVSKVQLKPAISQRIDVEKMFRGANAIKRNEVKFLTAQNVNNPVRKGTMVPFDIKGGYDFNVSFKDFSFNLMPVGTTYIRRGEVVVDSGVGSVSSMGGAMTGQRSFYDIYLWGDVKVEVPAGAKAVYIGTLVYEHDGKYSKKVKVKDEFKKAQRALEKKKIPGIRGKDLKKNLAKVIRQN